MVLLEDPSSVFLYQVAYNAWCPALDIPSLFRSLHSCAQTDTIHIVKNRSFKKPNKCIRKCPSGPSDPLLRQRCFPQCDQPHPLSPHQVLDAQCPEYQWPSWVLLRFVFLYLFCSFNHWNDLNYQCIISPGVKFLCQFMGKCGEMPGKCHFRKGLLWSTLGGCSLPCWERMEAGTSGSWLC